MRSVSTVVVAAALRRSGKRNQAEAVALRSFQKAVPPTNASRTAIENGPSVGTGSLCDATSSSPTCNSNPLEWASAPKDAAAWFELAV